jgi:hypothetical protein
MYTAIHTLYVYKPSTESYDENGDPIDGEQTKSYVCPCRCDDNSTKEFRDENGHVYRPTYHILCDGNASVSAGENIECLNKDGTMRGSGVVYQVIHYNILSYTEIWI